MYLEQSVTHVPGSYHYAVYLSDTAKYPEKAIHFLNEVSFDDFIILYFAPIYHHFQKNL
jgi:hypothetical protein